MHPTIYRGLPRQRGGSLGNIFAGFGRYIIPSLARSARKAFFNKIAPQLLTTGVGLMSDLAQRQSLSSAVKKRGQKLEKNVINEFIDNKPAQKPSRRRTRNIITRAPHKKKNSKLNHKKKPPKKRQPRKKDIFD